MIVNANRIPSAQCPSRIKALPALGGRSARLNVRHAEPSDGETLHAILHHPDVLYWTVDLPFAPQQEVQQDLLSPQPGSYVLLACDGPMVLGLLKLSVYPIARLSHIGRVGPVAVHPEHQGKGVGAALMQAAVDLADNWLNLHRLELLVFADNASAIALYQKYGFEPEGTLRHLAFRAGDYVDAHLMGRLHG